MTRAEEKVRYINKAIETLKKYQPADDLQERTDFDIAIWNLELCKPKLPKTIYGRDEYGDLEPYPYAFACPTCGCMLQAEYAPDETGEVGLYLETLCPNCNQIIDAEDLDIGEEEEELQ